MQKYLLIRKIFGVTAENIQVNFLRCVPLLAHLPPQLLAKLGDALETERWLEGEFIVREGQVSA